MNIHNTTNYRRLVSFCLIVLFSITACSEDQETAITDAQPLLRKAPSPEDNNAPGLNEEKITQQVQSQFNIGNKRYLFDVSNHTVEELEDLLVRIEEIIEVSPEAFEQLEMVMILHGPDINLFTQKNYSENKQLVDLAAKLDAFNVVDMKVCETAMSSMGVEREDIPPFIELVPYAPDTMRALEEEGYINL